MLGSVSLWGQMKIPVTPNMLNIDKLQINVSQAITRPTYLSVSDFFEQLGYKLPTIDGRAIRIYAANNFITASHYFFRNGNEVLRGLVGLKGPKAKIKSCDGNTNFIPSSVKTDDRHDYVVNKVPMFLAKECQAILNKMADSVNSILQERMDAHCFLYKTPRSRTFSLAKVEGGVDVPVQAGFELEKDHNFLENLAAWGKFKPPKYRKNKSSVKTKLSPDRNWTIYGTFHHFGKGNLFKIYLKDTSDPKLWIVRLELMPKGNAFKKMLGGKLFSVDPSRSNYIGNKLSTFLLSHVLPIAECIFDIDYREWPVSIRNQKMSWDLEESLGQARGKCMSKEIINSTRRHLEKNNLTFKPKKLIVRGKQLYPKLQSLLRKSPCFELVGKRDGIYAYVRKRLAFMPPQDPSRTDNCSARKVASSEKRNRLIHTYLKTRIAHFTKWFSVNDADPISFGTNKLYSQK